MNRLEILLDHLSKDPAESFLYFAIAKEYEAVNQFNEAITYYRQLKQVNPDYVGLYYHLGHAYEEIDQIGEAFSEYDEGIAIAKRLSDLHSLAELQNARQNLEISNL